MDPCPRTLAQLMMKLLTARAGVLTAVASPPPSMIAAVMAQNHFSLPCFIP